MNCSGWMTARRPRPGPKEANSVSLFLQIWQLRMPTLNQRLRSFPTESRATIFPRCRQDCPLPPPIIRGGFQGLKEREIRSKISQKPAFPPPVSAISSLPLSLSLSAVLATDQGHHQPFSPSYTTGNQHNHQAATAALSLLLPAFLSPWQLFLLPPTADSSHQHLRPLHSGPVTATPSPPLGRLPFFSPIVCNCVVACRTWTIVHVLQNNYLLRAGPVLA